MNQADLVAHIARERGYTKAESRRILKTVLEAIRAELKRGGKVRLRGFGTFETATVRGKRRARFREVSNFFQ
jgi:DNA-binding protein HU-beta